MSDSKLSEVEATLDQLVSKASQPTLASLFKKAKEKGLITTITGYGPNKEKVSEPIGTTNAPPQQGVYGPTSNVVTAAQAAGLTTAG